MYVQKNNPFQKKGPLKMIGGKKPEKKINPEEKNIKDEKWTASDTGHLALDVLGMIPGIGEVADGINASWYAKQGKYGDAALSGAAMIPGAGWAAGGTKIAKHMGKLKRVLGFSDKAKDVKNVSKTTKGKFNMGEDDMLKHVESHGTPYAPNGNVTGYWNQTNKEGVRNSVVAGNKLIDNAKNFNNTKTLNLKYAGDVSNRSVMEATIDNGQKVSFIRSTGGGGKSIDWVDEATGKKYKVTSQGINYPVMDKVHHITPTGQRGTAGHWFKHEKGGKYGNWFDGYGMKNFDQLGKGKFIPKKDAAGNLVFNGDVLQGTWDGGLIGDELIKQTTTIIDI
jgi:hypothetical protein